MSTPNPQSLADAMKNGFEGRPSNRLSSMATTEQTAPFAVPLDQDAYEVALDHIEPDPSQPRKNFEKNLTFRIVMELWKPVDQVVK